MKWRRSELNDCRREWCDSFDGNAWVNELDGRLRYFGVGHDPNLCEQGEVIRLPRIPQGAVLVQLVIPGVLDGLGKVV